ncbi:MAG: YncE family protein [Candidatus Parvarchaeota archaeon]|nr:YncE family protein [Candidatus Parvarchaeum tengchongense]
MSFKQLFIGLSNNALSIKSKRSQSALEYMMTYGWAILIIVIVAVILYSMGIFNPSSSVTFTSSGFTPFTISSTICNSIGLKVGIVAGPIPAGANSITVSKVYISSATGANTTAASYTLTNPVSLKSGQTAVLFIPNIACNSAGIKYSFSGNLQYSYSTTAGNVVENTTGTIAGTTSASVNSFTEYNLPANAQWTVQYSGVNHTSTSTSMTINSRYNSTWKIYPVDFNGVTYYPIYAGGKNLSTPYDLEVDFIPMRNLYVTNLGANNISMVYYNNNSLAKNPSGEYGLVSVGPNPFGIVMTPNGQYLYITDNNGPDNVSVISTSSNSVIAKIPVGSYPKGIVMTPNGQYVYVDNNDGDNVSVISTSSNSVIATIIVGKSPFGIAITPNGQFAYVTDDSASSNSVSVISTASNKVVATIPGFFGPRGIAITPNGQYVYVANSGADNVSVISTSSNSVILVIPIGYSVSRVTVSPNGQYVYVAGSNSVSVISTASNKVVATIPVGTSPNGITVTPNDEYLYVTNEGSDSISVISTSSDSVITTITGTLANPCGINYGPLEGMC